MKILVVYYSMHGHTLQLARAATEGAREIAGAEVILRRVQEFEDVDKEIDKHEHARAMREQQKDIPICTVEDLREANGVLFGSPTRYGNMTAQMKHLIDSTASLWLKGEMEGKPAGCLHLHSQHSWRTRNHLLTMMVPLLHLGMLVVGVPYSLPEMIHTEARGGTPYGATTIAGAKGELQPKSEDLNIARALGRRVAEITAKLRG